MPGGIGKEQNQHGGKTQRGGLGVGAMRGGGLGVGAMRGGGQRGALACVHVVRC